MDDSDSADDAHANSKHPTTPAIPTCADTVSFATSLQHLTSSPTALQDSLAKPTLQRWILMDAVLSVVVLSFNHLLD